MSRKSERLVNLTVALLATKRYLTKAEIFRTVAGYEGDLEAKERMFERDKEDLRSLGILIEVGTFDPLFEDEPGYRIKPESYRFQLDGLSSLDVSLLSLAAQIWQGAALNKIALSTLIKLDSLGIDSDLDSLPALAPIGISSYSELGNLFSAIAQRQVISFTYTDSSLSHQNRALELYGLATRNGRWYFSGRDLDKREIRTFRLDRVIGAIASQGKSAAYEIPANYSISDQLEIPNLETATLLVRRDKASTLRRQSVLISSNGDWDEISMPFADSDQLISDLLWHLDDVILLSPVSIRELLIGKVRSIIGAHE